MTARIPSDIDGWPVARTAGWQAVLLRRMANPYPGVRDAVISPDCHAAIDRMRAFRHRERDTCEAKLNLEVVVRNATDAAACFGIFRDDVRFFLGRS